MNQRRDNGLPDKKNMSIQCKKKKSKELKIRW